MRNAAIAGHAEYLLASYADAERAQREAIEARKKYLTEAVGDRRDIAEKSTWLAMAMARQGRLTEAAQVIAPVVAFHRELAAKNRGDQSTHCRRRCATCMTFGSGASAFSRRSEAPK